MVDSFLLLTETLTLSVWHLDADEVRGSPSHCFRPQAAVTYLREILKVPSSIKAYRQNFGSQNTYKKEFENVLDFQMIPPETSLEQRKAHGPEVTAQTQGDMVDPGRS